ncbi:hypothetical protein BDZ97DRAFT_1778563 [Flammula alnicola]|nr:hypothetical protein BDZ97DRAFT_1778563 [Flammula alnicola]
MEDQLQTDAQLFTCLSCSIAFLSPEDQRVHYRSDHHRYNMKRRVASLPPISVAVFNQKVLERRTETAVMSSVKGSSCEVCNKTYTTENAYRSHIQSKKHKENELKAASRPAPQAAISDTVDSAPEARKTPPKTSRSISSTRRRTSEEDEAMKTIDEKIAAARSRLSDTHCLFCNQQFASLDDNLTHMSTKGREFRSLDAVRKHMIAYEKEKDRLEVSDFYDFTTHTPMLVDEIVNESASDESSSGSESEEDEDDSPFELVLPSGARIGHRTMRRYYAQSFPTAPRGNKPEDPNSGAALVRRLLADKNSALVPRRGAFGAFGQGTEVVKARNRGEAREAGRHVREFRDMKRREDFKTKVGFIHNSQKHYRDPLLQACDLDNRIYSYYD